MASGNGLLKNVIGAARARKGKRQKKTVKVTSVCLTGDLGIKEAALFSEAIKENIDSGKGAQVKLDKISTIELPFVQALIAAGRVLKDQKLPVTGDIELYPDPAELLKRAGLFAELEKQGFNINIGNNGQK